MDPNQINEPLLGKKKAPLFVSSTKLVIKILILLLFVSWVAFIFLYATEFGNELFEKWIALTKGTPLGITGSLLLGLSGPILVIAILAIAYLIISGEDELQDQQKKDSKKPRFRLWTFPILVDGPFGVVSAAELIGILLFVAYIIWAVYFYTLRNLNIISEMLYFDKTKSIWLLELTGLRFGIIGLFCMAFLFLPIARGSVLLRLIDIPFEHATRYHVWLGHLTMTLFTLHGLFYFIGWTMEGELLRELLEWKDIGIANLAGVISLSAGLLMWVTSLPPVRKWNFEMFFYTHQLYVVFVVFLALHVGDFIFSMAAGPIFLFMLDRFLRFWQSRKTVDIISAKSFPCGTVELIFSKPKNLHYNALSFVFLQIRELSWLQWHPFSVSSSPSDGHYHLAILIKVLGKWTAQLRDNIRNATPAEQVFSQAHTPHTKITASVEGPYGHECPYHLMYENLVLVAGGIGISPFIAILSDVLHRVNEGRPCLPRNILIVWAVKKSDELPLLSTIDMQSICPNYHSKVNLEIHVYVTRESEPPLEEGQIPLVENSFVCSMSKGSGMSVLVGTGDNMWSGLYVFSSTVGFVVLLGLLYVFYINPYGITTWWYKGLLFMACMVASIFIFGGFVIALWHHWERKTLTLEDSEEDRIKVDHMPQNGYVPKEDMDQEDNVDSTIVRYGARPDFKEVFEAVSKRWGVVDVGVIVCGPPTLQSSVAREIRSHNLRRDFDDPIFHFNSHSFDL